MSTTPAPDPLPAGYEPDGLDELIATRFGGTATWRKAWEVTVAAPHATRWIGFVHEFELIEVGKPRLCFAVLPPRGADRPAQIYAQDDRIRDAADAARFAVAEQHSARRAEASGS